MDEFEISAEASSTKVDVNLDTNRVPSFDAKVGAHYWVMVLIYSVDPTKWKDNDEKYLDAENFATMTGPGCYYCELPFSRWLAQQRCRGPQ